MYRNEMTKHDIYFGQIYRVGRFRHGRALYGRWIYNYLCNQYLTPLNKIVDIKLSANDAFLE
jgi:hypothetical protein